MNCVFFIFSGNISKISAIKDFISSIVTKNTLVAGIVSCQFISNVPTAIFLSKFTENYRELLISVNIGSLGILISSLASLITFREYTKYNPEKTIYYIIRKSMLLSLYSSKIIYVNTIGGIT